MKAARPELDDAPLRLYLLGLLPEAEMEALEEAYLARPEVVERVRGVEDDLLEEYASGRLGDREKGAFETRYLASSPLRERVVLARALFRAVAAYTPVPAGGGKSMRPMRWGLAMAAGLFLAAAGFWIWPQHPPDVSGRAPAATSLVLALSPVLLRGQEQPAELRVLAGTDTVVLELQGDPAILPPAGSALEASIETVEGEQVWRGEARRVIDAARPSLLASARLPAARLGAGSYLLTLSARDTVEGTLHRYFFRVGR